MYSANIPHNRPVNQLKSTERYTHIGTAIAPSGPQGQWDPGLLSPSPSSEQCTHSPFEQPGWSRTCGTSREISSSEHLGSIGSS